MKVSEIFCSIQGEGHNAGKKAVFLRTALCNLACEWCDTKYTWDWKNYDYATEVREMSVEQVKANLLKYQLQHLVLTGGEPLLQQHQLLPLLESLKKLGFFIEVETNGTIIPNDKIVEAVDQWNVSPKLENSANSLVSRERPEAYCFFQQLPNSTFKYVVRTPEDLNEVKTLVERYNIPRSKVILMPEARTKEDLAERTMWLESISNNLGYSFSTRLQIELWGDKRGV